MLCSVAFCCVVFCCLLPCSAMPCCALLCLVLFCATFCSVLWSLCSVFVLFCVLCSLLSFLFGSVLFSSILLRCVASLIRPAVTKTLIICLCYGGAHRVPCTSFFIYNNRLSQEQVHRHFAWFLQSGTWDDFELQRPGPLFGFGHFDIVGLQMMKQIDCGHWLLCNYTYTHAYI